MPESAFIERREQLAADKKRQHRIWFECSECHGTVDPQDLFCSTCGRKLLKKG